MMLELELKPGNREFLACGLPQFTRWFWSNHYLFTMMITCMVFYGSVL